jgi:hypothetical protein
MVWSAPANMQVTGVSYGRSHTTSGYCAETSRYAPLASRDSMQEHCPGKASPATTAVLHQKDRAVERPDLCTDLCTRRGGTG